MSNPLRPPRPGSGRPTRDRADDLGRGPGTRTADPLALALLLALLPGCGDACPTNQNNQNAGPRCGDGVVDPGEACDTGEHLSDTRADACRLDCTLARCGDGVVDGAEACDQGAANHDETPGACRTSCVLPTCGDGVVDPDETCDDGGTSGGDGCGETCQVEDRYACSGAPSVCVCAVPFGRTPDCDQCAVLVNAAAPGLAEDGLTWETAYRSVTAGVAAAAGVPGGCGVWLVQGTYFVHQGDDTDTIAVPSHVHLYGGFAGSETAREQRDPASHRTVLEGSRAVDHVVEVVDAEDVVLDGLEIVGGAGSRGAGVYVSEAEVTLRRCALYLNQAWDGGAGLYAEDSGVRLDHCRISANETSLADDFLATGGKGAGLLAERTALVVNDTELRGNLAQVGGGLALVDSTASFTGGSFRENEASLRGGEQIFNIVLGTGGGAWVDGTSHLVIEDAILHANRAETGAGIHAEPGSVVHLVYSLLVGNDARCLRSFCEPDGGAVLAVDAELSVVNCTIAYNVAGRVGEPGRGAGVLGLGGSVTVYNAILWGNWPSGLQSAGTSLTVAYSDLQDGGSGPGVISADPRFVNPSVGDWRLAADSPCIDAAWGDVTEPTDLAGHPPADAPGVPNTGGGTLDYVDMGCYEYQP
jgi:cysteine-rich repeat protein